MAKGYKSVKIEVTEEDIEKGKQSDGTSCPVALAMMRATGSTYVYVDYIESRIAGELIYTPKKAEEFMRDFDSDSEIRPGPFAFEIELEDREAIVEP
jgi:hypothetical protein